MSQRVINDIKTIVRSVIDAMKLPDIRIGTVTSVSPVRIDININMPPLPSSAIIVPQHVSLGVGDKVAMIRGLGGQTYIVVGKI